MRHLLWFIVILLTLGLSACVPVFVPVPTASPTVTPSPRITASPPIGSPTQITLAAFTPKPSHTPIPLAPTCSVDPLIEACTLPQAATLSRTCVKKVPYVLIGLSPGSTLEILDSGLTCRDEKVRGKWHQYSCTGQQLYSYRVKVCSPACSSLLTADERCPDGSGFYNNGACCWPLPAPNAGCVVYTVNVGACP